MKRKMEKDKLTACKLVWKNVLLPKRNFGKMCGENSTEVHQINRTHAIWECNDSFP